MRLALARCSTLSAIFLLTLTACGPATSGSSAPTDALLAAFGADTTQGTGTAAELRQRKAQWVKIAPAHYTYVHVAECFCIESVRQPTEMEVQNGVVIGARVVQTGAAVANPTEFQRSIEQLFDMAIEAAERGVVVEATYDEKVGAPVRIVIGTLANDAGVGHRVSKIQAR